MPVRTRRQAREQKSIEPDCKYDDCWDNPESNLKPSIIKTYSKKQPLRTCWNSESKMSSKMSQESYHFISSKPDSPVKPKREKINQEMSSKLPRNTPVSIRKASTTQTTSRTNMMSSCMRSRSTTRRKGNKTRLAVEPMTACSILPNQPSDMNIFHEDMSLCSMANVQIKELDNIKNSTLLQDCHYLNKDFVPNEISAIEGQTELQDTIISNYNEQTPKEKQKTVKTPARSAKKVRFVSKNAKTPLARNNCQPSAKRSILRKTPCPRRNKQSQHPEKRPQTSSPDPNKEFSMLNCEISTLLTDDHYPKKTRSKSRSRSDHMTEDTEKLILDSEKLSEPVPLECSEDFGENSRDVTPETCNTIKELTSSAKRRRRLFCNFGEEIPICFLLDYRGIKTKKKSQVLFSEVAHVISPEDLKSFSYDMLL